MIVLSNGHAFEYMAASGALAFDGRGWAWEWPLRWLGFLDPSLFTVVAKTLTIEPRQGNLRWFNPFRCIRFLPNGTVNAVGLSNYGIDRWCREVGPRIRRSEIAMICSIHGNADELAAMAKRLNDFDLVGLEINASCPNVSDIQRTDSSAIVAECQAVREVSRLPIVLKLSVVHDVETIASAVSGLVEAFSINSVPWSTVFPGRPSPLARLGGGGISGQAAQPFTWQLVRRLATASQIPVIAPSVWRFEDLDRARRLGAGAVSFGSLFLRYPWRPTQFVRKDKERRNRRG